MTGQKVEGFGGEHAGTRLAEQATLGACLLNAAAFTDVAAILEVDDFAFPAHRLVWEAMHKVRVSGRPADASNTLVQMLDDATATRLPEGGGYLHTLVATPVSWRSGTFHAKDVKRYSLNRQLAALAGRVAQQAATGDDPATVIGGAQRALTGLLSGAAVDSYVRWGSIADGAMTRVEEAGQQPDGPVGLPTGVAELDRLIHGSQPGRLHLVAALSSMGKSVFLGDIFRAWVNAKIPCCLITLEMSRDEVWRRQASAACRIDHDRINRGDLGDGDWSRIARWVGDTAEAPAWVCDRPRMSLAEIEALVLRGVEQHGWRGVIVDYVQIVRHRAATREREVAEVGAGLKEIGRTANVAMWAGAQLNREATRRGTAPPRLSDLRESAALEHEPDVAVLIHRPDQVDKNSPRIGEADLILEKNRGGAKGVVTVAAQMHWQRFKPFDADELTACVSCYQPHPAPQGTRCTKCAA